MPDITLNDSDRHFLRQCPQTVRIMPRSRPSSAELGKLRMIQRLQQAGLIRGRIDAEASSRDMTVTDITLTNAGRRAIGLPELADAR